MSSVVARSDMPVGALRVLIALVSTYGSNGITVRDLVVSVRIHPSQLFAMLETLIDRELVDQLTVPNLGPGQFDQRFYALTEAGLQVALAEIDLLTSLLKETNLHVQ